MAVKFNAQNAYKDQTFKEATITDNHIFKLAPFEVLCLEPDPKQ